MPVAVVVSAVFGVMFFQSDDLGESKMVEKNKGKEKDT